MTDEVQAASAAAYPAGTGALPNPSPEALAKAGDETRDPMAKAIEGGYKPEAQPSREERAAAVVAALEHAIAHNAPVTLAMLKDIRDLLDVAAPDDTPVAQVSEVEA